MAGKFLRIKCKCGQEKTVFSHVSNAVACEGCATPLAVPRGGEAAFFAKIIKEVG